MLECYQRHLLDIFFFFNDTATTEIYTLSLHDALPISIPPLPKSGSDRFESCSTRGTRAGQAPSSAGSSRSAGWRDCRDRKSTRLNSSHANISYAVFCLKKKKPSHPPTFDHNRSIPRSC